MHLVLEGPTRLRLPAAWIGTPIEEKLQKDLAYEDLRATHEWRRLVGIQKQDDRAVASNSTRPWFVVQNSREELDRQVEAAEAERHKSALFRDDAGMWTYSGLADRLHERLGVASVLAYERPAYRPMVYERQPPHPLRPFQVESVEKLMALGHGGVELATGLGKSYIIAELFRRAGLTGIVVAPSLNIANQLLEDLTFLFGKRRVGQFFDGKKDAKKQLTVAVSASLIRVEPDSEVGRLLRSKQVLIGDESHLLPAESLSKVILGLLADVPYRWFLSGTQIRNDGLDIVLDGIVGTIVKRMNVRQGVEAGFLSAPRFSQFEVQSNSRLNCADTIKMNRVHLQANPNVYKHAGRMIRWAVKSGRRVLVLVDQLDQYQHLMEIGKVKDIPHRFAHGGMDAKQREEFKEYPDVHKSDPMALVKAFDRGEYQLLIGTSCIGTGTDIKSADFIIDIVGLTSEIRVRQNVGRGTRQFPGKKDCVYVDYDVTNIEKLTKHAKTRKKIFEDIYGPVRREKVN